MAWITETFINEPKKIVEVGEELDVKKFLALASESVAVRWTADFQKAKAFLVSVNKRIAKNARRSEEKIAPYDAFHRHRQNQGNKARIESRLLVHVEPDLTINLPRAPDVREILAESLNEIPKDGFDISVRELLGMIGAHEWRKNGVEVPVLEEKIFPYYGVFSPVRGEYLELLASAPLPPNCKVAFDVGTGTGVVSAILAKRGVPKIIATDIESRALKCAAENLARLGFAKQVEVCKADLFPDGEADLIVCNPPWIPARPSTRFENAIYDFENKMLRAFLSDASKHLNENGEVWLIISNLAELLQLRPPFEVVSWIKAAGLSVIDRSHTKPKHAKSRDEDDPLFEARSKEITTLWRLGVSK
jgi:methylase of polypeptide subunit release factors